MFRQEISNEQTYATKNIIFWLTRSIIVGIFKINADRPHLCNYPHTSTDGHYQVHYLNRFAVDNYRRKVREIAVQYDNLGFQQPRLAKIIYRQTPDSRTV